MAQKIVTPDGEFKSIAAYVRYKGLSRHEIKNLLSAHPTIYYHIKT